jgi:hypothetical protein
MENDIAVKIILNVVETTEPTWRQYGIYWSDIDYLFIQRGYEQGGFNTSKFSKLLEEKNIFSINKLGGILEHFKFDKKYKRDFAGNPENQFYQDLKKGKAGDTGRRFYKVVENFKGHRGYAYYQLLWRMLVCCNYLKTNYNGNFSNFLTTKYSEFKNKEITENEFMNISLSEWESFKKTKPWDKLYGIGENVFDFLIGDLIDEDGRSIEFAKNSYKLDDSNIRFLKATGICKNPEHDIVTTYLKDLNLPYTIREINKGIYSYCSKTALNEVEEGVYIGDPGNHGFCYLHRCSECKVYEICEKNFD